MAGRSVGHATVRSAAVNLALHGAAPVASLSLIDPACVFARFPLRMLLASLAAVPTSPQWLRDRMLSWISGGAPVDDGPIARVISAAMREYRIATLRPPTLATTRCAACACRRLR